MPRRFPEASHALLDRVVDRARNRQQLGQPPLSNAAPGRDLAARDKRGENLFDEEWVTLRQAIERVQKLAWGWAPGAEDRTHHRRHVVAAEAGQGQLAGEALALETGDDVGQTVVGLVAAIGEKQSHWLLGGVPR